MARQGIRVAPIDDTMLMSYAMQAGLNQHGMDTLSEKYLGHHADPDQIAARNRQVAGHLRPRPGGRGGEIRSRRCRRDAAPVAARSSRNCTVLACHDRLRDAGTPPRARAGRDGDGRACRWTATPCRRMSNAFAQKMAGLEEEIHQLAGEKFNVGSPKQLGEILFDRMSLPGGEKGKTGAYATGRGCAGRPRRRRPRPARPRAGLAAAFQAEIHLYRRTAGPHQPRDRARPHVLFDHRGGHRAAVLDRPEPAEHPDPHRRGPPHPRGLRGPERAAFSSASTTARSNCASWPMSPTSRR